LDVGPSWTECLSKLFLFIILFKIQSIV
jgi:hypothetical protein